jgi:post-segregation antitoxin (ccd killing protein)
MEVVYAGVPELAFTEAVCAAGIVVDPAWAVKVRAAGVAVSVTAADACNAEIRAAQNNSFLLT